MIAFKDITPEDKESITAYTMHSNRRNCDLSFSNLCSWRFLYHTQFAIIDNFLVFRFWVEDDLAYMMPIGDGDLLHITERLIKDAHDQTHQSCMLWVSKYMIEYLEA